MYESLTGRAGRQLRREHWQYLDKLLLADRSEGLVLPYHSPFSACPGGVCTVIYAHTYTRCTAALGSLLPLRPSCAFAVLTCGGSVISAHMVWMGDDTTVVTLASTFNASRGLSNPTLEARGSTLSMGGPGEIRLT